MSRDRDPGSSAWKVLGEPLGQLGKLLTYIYSFKPGNDLGLHHDRGRAKLSYCLGKCTKLTYIHRHWILETSEFVRH